MSEDTIARILVSVDVGSQIRAGVAPTNRKRIPVDLSALTQEQRDMLSKMVEQKEAALVKPGTDVRIFLQHPAELAELLEAVDREMQE